MFLLWGDDLATALHDPALHERVAQASAYAASSLNVDDDTVAAAMRIPHFEEPVGAIVSVWDADA